LAQGQNRDGTRGSYERDGGGLMSTQITPGKYRAKATSKKFGKTSKGSEQIYVDFEITQGPHAGQHLAWYGYFSEKAADRTLESLEFCGWDGESSLLELKGFGSKEVELVAEIEKDDRDGREYLKVRWVNRIGGGVKEELDRGGVAALDQKMKGIMLARKQKRANETPMREPGDDDFGPTDYGDMPPV
jgi:hypothetical protein